MTTVVGVRACNWSITINNPTADDLTHDWVMEHPGWSLQGQLEVGANGTEHFQGLLKTPNKPSFSSIKKLLPRAHIEPARDKSGKHLEAYVHKEDTRIGLVPTATSAIPTLFAYQKLVAARLSVFTIDDDFAQQTMYQRTAHGNEWRTVSKYIDAIINDDIRKGIRGIEFIAINPMWLSSWKKYWRSIIIRETTGIRPELLSTSTA